MVCTLVAVAVALGPACDSGSDTAGPGPGPGGCEHVDYAVGIELRQQGTQLYRQSGTQISGTIEVMNGGSVQGIEAMFLDAAGADIPIPNDCTINELRFDVADPSVIEITRPSGLRWSFDVVAKREATTTLRVLLWHENHAHFRSELIPVNVVP
jgi:hypothetical protein